MYGFILYVVVVVVALLFYVHGKYLRSCRDGILYVSVCQIDSIGYKCRWTSMYCLPLEK